MDAYAKSETQDDERLMNGSLALRHAWIKFKRGDSITDLELEIMIKAAESGVPYLRSRGPEFELALKETLIDLEKLRGFLSARREK